MEKSYYYKLYQPHRCEQGVEPNTYSIRFEWNQWTLDSGGNGIWMSSNEPEIVKSKNIDEKLRKLNQDSLHQTIKDYMAVSEKVIDALSTQNEEAINSFRKRKEWCYLRWKDIYTVFETQGWKIDIKIPDIFRFIPSNDYRTITLKGQIVHLTQLQSSVIKVLHLNFLKGHYSLSTEKIFSGLTKLGIRTHATKISQIFADNKDAKELLIKEVGRGRYSLNIPPI